jgi:hypothetical protein
MKPQRYQNLQGDSGITYFASGPDWIAVQFKGPVVYVYDGTRPGKTHVEQMKALAIAGRGLGTYISQNVGANYARKQQGW